MHRGDLSYKLQILLHGNEILFIQLSINQLPRLWVIIIGRNYINSKLCFQVSHYANGFLIYLHVLETWHRMKPHPQPQIHP